MLKISKNDTKTQKRQKSRWFTFVPNGSYDNQIGCISCRCCFVLLFCHLLLLTVFVI